MKPTFRTYERKFILTFDDRVHMELFVENLQEQLRFVELLLTGVPKRLKITLRGEKEAVKQACRTLKWLQKSIQGIVSKDSQNRLRWDFNYFQHIIGGVSPDLVLKALQFKGYEMEIHQDFFLTTADVYAVQDVAYSIHIVWGELSKKVRSQSLKRVVTLASVIRNEDLTQIFKEGINRGIISEGENRLTSNPENALKLLLNGDNSQKQETI